MHLVAPKCLCRSPIITLQVMLVLIPMLHSRANKTTSAFYMYTIHVVFTTMLYVFPVVVFDISTTSLTDFSVKYCLKFWDIWQKKSFYFAIVKCQIWEGDFIAVASVASTWLFRPRFIGNKGTRKIQQKSKPTNVVDHSTLQCFPMAF